MKRVDVKRHATAALMLPFGLSSLFGAEVAPNNSGIEAYGGGDFAGAVERLEEAVMACESGGGYCDEVQYNLGNSYYRQGQQVEGDERRELWEKSVAAYEQSVALNGEDVQARENLEFVKQKLQEQNQQQQSGEEQQQEQSGGESGDQGSESEESGEGESAEQQDGSSNGQGGGERDQEQQSAGQQQRLSERTNQQVEEYMEQMEQGAQEYEDYFNRNPNAEPQPAPNPFESAFGGSLFDRLFGGNPFRQERGGNEVDW